jgi:hypothetical protein
MTERLGIEQLQEWYKQCTIDQCGEDTAGILSAYGSAMFSLWLDRCGQPLENPDLRAGDSAETAICWHLLELRLNTGTHRSGKYYKDWLFDYAAGVKGVEAQVASLRSGLRLMFQMTVRDYCAGLLTQREKDRRYGVVSLDETLRSGDDRSKAFGVQADYLMGKTDDFDGVSDDDVQEMARSICGRLPLRHQVVLLVKYTEVERIGGSIIALDHPAVLQAAGCGKSQLYAARRELGDLLRGEISAACGAHREDVDDSITACVLAALADQILSQKKSEKDAQPFLQYLEGQKRM